MLDEVRKYSALSLAAATSARVGGLTHGFYRYPARFGDAFVREAICHFSRRSEVVLDPFCGGGTSLVEALACGRKVVGSDVSELALFLARVKTTPLSDQQLDVISNWVAAVSSSTRELLTHSTDAQDPRLAGLRHPYRNLVCNLKRRTLELPRGESRNFASCLLLKVGQWAFDGKQHAPRPSEIIERLSPSFEDMRKGALAYRRALCDVGLDKKPALMNRRLVLSSARSLSAKRIGVEKERVSLVVTSPPYLGVHVLYNKWQLEGRREIRLPFYLSDCQDIGGASAYTIIDRKASAHARYYEEIRASFSAVERLLQPRSYVIQLVSFSDANAALPRYLSALKEAGLELCESYIKSTNGLAWRPVPSRKWYARVGAISDSSASEEVLLVHRNRG